MDLADFRKEYSDRGLRRESMAASPIDQFSEWFEQAVEMKVHEPNAMTLATVDGGGAPWQRTVLLKSFTADGFCFFTNYQSRKATQIAGNPRVSLLFPWITLERQVIVSGVAEKMSVAESEEYFQTRPRESQLGAWVSHQSSVIPSREFLREILAGLEARFSDREIPLPPFWGGFRVVPRSVEFWQGGPARLHDRFFYTRTDAGWKIERLSP